MLQSLNILSSNFPFSLSHPLKPSLLPSLSSSSLTFLYKPTTLHSVSALPPTRPEPWLAQVPEPTTITVDVTEPEEGPVELPPSSNSIFATNDDPTPLQIATSVLLTGSITIFLFRSIRRRAKRAKELRFRSSRAAKSLKDEALDSLKAMTPGSGEISVHLNPTYLYRFRSSGATGAKKSLKDEALDSLKAMTPGTVEAKSPPSAIQALLGGISAGVIALVLYKFTTTIEASLNRQTISDNFSVRQITVTIRTIINGICYLATFVFGINAVGLVLYAGQLAINSLMEDFSSDETNNQDEGKSSSVESAAESPTDSTKMNSSDSDQSSDKTQ